MRTIGMNLVHGWCVQLQLRILKRLPTSFSVGNIAGIYMYYSYNWVLNYPQTPWSEVSEQLWNVVGTTICSDDEILQYETMCIYWLTCRHWRSIFDVRYLELEVEVADSSINRLFYSRRLVSQERDWAKYLNAKLLTSHLLVLLLALGFNRISFSSSAYDDMHAGRLLLCLKGRLTGEFRWEFKLFLPILVLCLWPQRRGPFHWPKSVGHSESFGRRRW